MEFELVKLEAEELMNKAIEAYNQNISKISAGRANPSVLDSIKVDYFDTLTPINQLASISIPDPKQLLIKPFDITINKLIVGVINSSSLGFNAVDEGDKTRITLPDLTTERRKELVKSLGKYTEQARVEIRNARQNANKNIKAIENLPKDDDKRFQEEIQKMTNDFIQKIDSLTKDKEKDLMKI